MTDRSSIDHPRFAVRGVLGRGVEGSVYEALDRDAGELVALKRVAPVDVPAFRKLFGRLGVVRHPGIVRIRALHFDRDVPFFVMDRIHGVDFVTHVRKDVRAMPPPDVVRPTLPLAFGQPVQEGNRSAFRVGSESDGGRLRRAAAGLLDALAALHAVGIVHGDLHPDNVRVGDDDRVTLVDFGLAHLVGDARADGDGVAGTSAYMAPEAGDASRIGTASDVYGAGVLFYEGLTGALPFTGSADDVVRRKGSLPAPPPAFVVPSVPDDLDRLVTAMLERDPTRRPDAPRCLLALGMQVSSMGDRNPR